MGDDRQAKVVIGGGGPVGLGLAIELGQRGVPVTVVERHLRPQPVPKGQNLTQRTMEHFQAWRCEAELRAAAPIPAHKGSGGMTAYRTLLSGWHYDWLNRKWVRPYYNAANERLPQYETEHVLRARAAALPSVDIRYGWSVTGLAQDDTGVSVEIAERDGPGAETLRAAYLVGADGARSTVREAAGMSQTRFDHDRQMMLLVFHAPDLEQLLERFPGKSFFNILHPALEGYWLFLGRVDLDANFFFHAPMPPGADAETFDFAAYVQQAVGEAFPMRIDYTGFWDCRVSIADAYRAGRIFVAGDAAHSHPPYGGYGINTGFEDARNLGWKLAAELQGWAGPGLLESYDAERRPVFWSTAKDFIEKAIETDRQFLASHDPEVDRAAFEAAWSARGGGAKGEVDSFQPNYRGSPVVAGSGDGAVDARAAHAFTARAGFHLAPATLSDGGQLYDRLGAGFTLLEFGDAPLAPAFAEAARTMGLPLETVQLSPGEETRRYEADAILVRPDHFVAWAGGAGDEPPKETPAAILKRAAGYL